MNDPAFTLTPSTRRRVEAEGYRAVLSVPLLVGDRAIGAVVLYRDDLPVAFLTGWGDQLDPARVRAAGIRVVMAKPVDPEDLIRGIAEALALRS